MDNQLKRRNQSGNSMIEILVATFILAGGLFGLSALQTYSLKNINNAQFHTLATSYAYEMAERMRSNRDGLSSGAYDGILSTVAKPNCGTCSSTDIAQLDGFEWNQQIKSAVNVGGLPQGAGTVTRNGAIYTIVVSWNEQQRDNNGGNVGVTNFTLNVQI